LQDDVSIISSVFDFKTDDYTNVNGNAATTLTGTVDGTINTNNDVDVFILRLRLL